MMIIVQVILAFVMLGLVVVLLISINHLVTGNYGVDQKEVNTFRKEVKEKADVLTKNNIFCDIFIEKTHIGIDKKH